MTRTVLIVDDHELVRLGLRAVLAGRFGGRFSIAEAGSLAQALAFLDHRHEDVLAVLLDLNLGDARGLAGLQLVRQRWPRLPVVVVSGTHDERVRGEAAVHGARAYLCKAGEHGGLGQLLEAVERIAAEQAEGTAVHPAAPEPVRLVEGQLGKRQVQVLELILAGHDNESISRETGLVLGSVKNCVSSIFLVFNVRSRGELISLFSG